VIIRQGEEGDQLYFVNKGEVSVTLEVRELRKRQKDFFQEESRS